MRVLTIAAALAALCACSPAAEKTTATQQPATAEAPFNVLAGLNLPALSKEPNLTADRARIEACLAQSMDKGRPADLCTGAVQVACIDADVENQSTAGMVGCTERETTVWQALLAEANAKAAEASPAMKAAVARAQQAFERNRDVQCDLAAVAFEGGTMAAPMSAGCIKQLTADQYLRMREFGPQ